MGMWTADTSSIDQVKIMDVCGTSTVAVVVCVICESCAFGFLAVRAAATMCQSRVGERAQRGGDDSDGRAELGTVASPKGEADDDEPDQPHGTVLPVRPAGPARAGSSVRPGCARTSRCPACRCPTARMRCWPTR